MCFGVVLIEKIDYDIISKGVWCLVNGHWSVLSRLTSMLFIAIISLPIVFSLSVFFISFEICRLQSTAEQMIIK